MSWCSRALSDCDILLPASVTRPVSFSAATESCRFAVQQGHQHLCSQTVVSPKMAPPYRTGLYAVAVPIRIPPHTVDSYPDVPNNASFITCTGSPGPAINLLGIKRRTTSPGRIQAKIDHLSVVRIKPTTIAQFGDVIQRSPGDTTSVKLRCYPSKQGTVVYENGLLQNNETLRNDGTLNQITRSNPLSCGREEHHLPLDNKPPVPVSQRLPRRERQEYVGNTNERLQNNKSNREFVASDLEMNLQNDIKEIVGTGVKHFDINDANGNNADWKLEKNDVTDTKQSSGKGTGRGSIRRTCTEKSCLNLSCEASSSEIPAELGASKHARSKTLPTKVVLNASCNPPVPLEAGTLKSLSLSITSFFRRMSPLASRRHLNSANDDSHAKAFPASDGCGYSAEATDACHIRDDTGRTIVSEPTMPVPVGKATSRRSSFRKSLKMSPLRRLFPGSSRTPKEVRSVAEADGVRDQRCDGPSDGSRLVHTSLGEDLTGTGHQLSFYRSFIAKGKDSPKCNEGSLGIRPQALQVIEFPDGILLTGKSRNVVDELMICEPIPDPSCTDHPKSMLYSGANHSISEPHARTGGLEVAATCSSFPVVVQETSSAKTGAASATSMAPLINRRGRKPPSSLNIRAVHKLNKQFYEFYNPSLSLESIGQCSLSTSGADSEVSLVRNGTQCSTSLSKQTLASHDNIPNLNGGSVNTSQPMSTSTTHSLREPCILIGFTNDTPSDNVLGHGQKAVVSLPPNGVVHGIGESPSYLKLSRSIVGYNTLYNTYTPGLVAVPSTLGVGHPSQNDDRSTRDVDVAHSSSVVVSNRHRITPAQNGSALVSGEFVTDMTLDRACHTASSVTAPTTIVCNKSVDLVNSNPNAYSVLKHVPLSSTSVGLPEADSHVPTVLWDSPAALSRPVTSLSVSNCAGNVNGHNQLCGVVDGVDQQSVEHIAGDSTDVGHTNSSTNGYIKHPVASASDTSSPQKDGMYFLHVVAVEERRLQTLCTQTELDLQASLSEEVEGKIRAAIGKATLLTNKKFKQFRQLCAENMDQTDDAQFRTTSQDLAGFWDMVLIQILDVCRLFEEIDQLRTNNWIEPTSPMTCSTDFHLGTTNNSNATVLSAKPTVKSKGGAHPNRGVASATVASPKSSKAAEASKARDEARRRLIAAKQAGRQRKASESDQDIEIYVS